MEYDISVYKLGLISMNGNLISKVSIVSHSDNINLIRGRSRIIGRELYNIDVLMDI